jgi:hypothetical protein
VPLPQPSPEANEGRKQESGPGSATAPAAPQAATEPPAPFLLLAQKAAQVLPLPIGEIDFWCRKLSELWPPSTPPARGIVALDFYAGHRKAFPVLGKPWDLTTNLQGLLAAADRAKATAEASARRRVSTAVDDEEVEAATDTELAKSPIGAALRELRQAVVAARFHDPASVAPALLDTLDILEHEGRRVAREEACKRLNLTPRRQQPLPECTARLLADLRQAAGLPVAPVSTPPPPPPASGPAQQCVEDSAEWSRATL